MYKDIEFVCGGNSGRSPFAEAAARKYLSEIGYDARVSSSGTLVRLWKDMDGLMALVRKYDSSLGRDDIEMLAENELSRTKRILEEKSLTGCLADFKVEGTMAREDAGLILAISKDNYGRVKDLYGSSGLNPDIELLGEFDDPFFRSYEEHRRIADEIEEAIISRLEMIFGYCLKK